MYSILTTTSIIIFFITVFLIVWRRWNKKFLLEKERYSKLLSQKKSSEVRLGQITEQLAPFLDGFPVDDPKELTFLGMPIDYVHFGEEAITFIEVKSGKSKLSPKQKMIQRNIEEGRVYFTTYRVE